MITKITNKDEKILKMLYCCGVITDYGIELMEISKYKISLYIEQNLIQAVYENGKKGYKLTSKAKKMISKLYGLNRSYTYRSINHCSKLQEIYLNLDLNRYRWITESEALDLLNKKVASANNYYNNIEKHSNISPVDAIIIDLKTNVLYGIEIVSKSYRECDLNKKENFLKILDIEAIFIQC